MTTSQGRLAVWFFLCLLRSVIEMRNLDKGFYSAAVNIARAGKKTACFPVDVKTYS